MRHLEAWENSEELHKLTEEVNKYSTPYVQNATGLETWFTLPDSAPLPILTWFKRSYDRMLSRFEVLLSSIVQQPDARLSALSLQTESAKQDEELSSRKRLLSIKPKPIQFPANV